MARSETKFTQNSFLSVGLVSSVLAAMIGGGGWLTSIWAQGAANRVAIEKIESREEILERELKQIREDVAYIRGQMERGK